MCGFAGALDLISIIPDFYTVQDMSDTLIHRGPDQWGLKNVGPMAMAHYRLAIIDPEHGQQPMTRDNLTTVCFNGTIYNYHVLRKELERLGYVFETNCDTEVLVCGWGCWGTALVPKLNGHFSFAIWEHDTQRLFLVRDRFGTKPLYYANIGGLWLFASEIKAILKHPAYSMEINFEALQEYFTFQNLFRYHTLFKGIHLLPPANIMQIDADTGHVARESYWDWDFSHPDEGMDEATAVQGVRQGLAVAVQRQLFADVPVGAYLSGGLDSSLVTALASREVTRLNTFSVGFHGEHLEGVEIGSDERAQAEAVAAMFGTQHFEQVIGHTDSWWILKDLIWHLEDLRMGMCYANWYAARLASKFVKVCLTGVGGDELFAGYPWRYRALSVGAYYGLWQRLTSYDDQDRMFTAAVSRVGADDLYSVFERVFTFQPNLALDTPEHQVAAAMYFEAKTFLPGLLLLGDRLSMAHSLEERHPFLDNDLVDFAQKIPVRFKLKNIHMWHEDENNPRKYAAWNDGKRVLRQAAAGILPETCLERPKQGFSSPDGSWYRGPDLRMVRGLLMDPKALCHEFIKPDFIEQVIADHVSRRRNMRLLIWSLLSFEVWMKTFIEEKRPA